MPITLITGTPGAGKTLYAVTKIIEELAPTGRQIYTDIDGLNVDFDNVHVLAYDEDTEEPKLPKVWWDQDATGIEDGAIFVFDEVQRCYPPRNTMSKVPRYISEYETHRHRGFDFYFVTQGPRLIDRHLHDLITKHIHLYRPFGVSRAIVYNWNLVNPQPNPAQTKSNAVTASFAYPKKHFAAYKSASQHTIQRKLPAKPIFYLVGSAAVLAFAAYMIPKQIADTITTGEEIAVDVVTGEGPRCDGRLVGKTGSHYLVLTPNGIVQLPHERVDSSTALPHIVFTKSGKAICNS